MLRASGVVKSHDGTPALRGVSLAVRKGEVLAVTGPRGSGKTTLLGCLSGQLPVDEGEVWFNDLPLHTLSRADRERLRREQFGWVGSQPDLIPELTAAENVALPLLLAGTGRKAARIAAAEWLERLDVADCARRRPAELIQSQRQRIAVARALAPMPAVVFADDPVAPLHRANQEQVLRVLTTAARSHGLTMVLALHEPAQARHADRTVALLDGQAPAPADPAAKPAPAADTDVPDSTDAPLAATAPAAAAPA
ncbi:ABC transporter ATP-binding protein [Peterkaempfera sp. SMS 1(5)a]